MSSLQKARRTQHFPDPRLEHQIDELVRAINAAVEALEQIGVDIDLRISQHAADTSLHITRDYRDARDNSLVHPSATNPFVTEESLNDAMTGSAKPGVQTLEDLAAIPPDQRADKDTRLVEDEGKIYRFDADADHGDVKPLEGPGWWIAVAAATPNHNNLSNLQGGSATERYHLTKAERDSLVAHLADTNNPHQVTAAQVGAYPAGSKVADSESLNGQPASYYTNIVARLGYTPVNRAGDEMTGKLTAPSYGSVDTRDTPTSPGDYEKGMRLQFKRLSSIGLNGIASGTYCQLVGYRAWGDDSGGRAHEIAFTDGGDIYYRNGTEAGGWGPWQKLWHAGNDGSGSGLDADLLDGQHGSYYAKASDLDAIKSYVDALLGPPMAAGTNFVVQVTKPGAEISFYGASYPNWEQSTRNTSDSSNNVAVCIFLPGTVRCALEHRSAQSGQSSYVRVLKNGSVVQEWSTNSTSFVSRSVDVNVSPGDVITFQQRLSNVTARSMSY